jgi:hypothetical protein
MASYALLIPIVAVVIIVALLLWGMRGRGKLIECPECGAKFKRPAFAEKSSGVGFSIPGLGSYTCPQCKHRDRTSNFRYVEQDGSAKSGTAGNE